MEDEVGVESKGGGGVGLKITICIYVSLNAVARQQEIEGIYS